MVKKGVLVVFILLVPIVYGDVLINEIMYNPSSEQADDSDLEWIELYTNTTQEDLANWILDVSGTEAELGDVIYDYIVIARELEDGTDGDNDSFREYYGYDIFAVDGPGWSLGNTEDYIELRDDEGTIIHRVEYLDDWGGDGNGKTIAWYNDSWQESDDDGTPGEENTVPPVFYDLELEAYIKDFINMNQQYRNFFKITNVNYKLGKVYNISLFYNITKNGTLVLNETLLKDEVNKYSTSGTGTWSPNVAGNYTICGWILNSSIVDEISDNDLVCKNFTVVDSSVIPCDVYINITTEKDVFYSEDEKLEYWIKINNKSFPYKIEYWIEDLFEIEYKDKRNTTRAGKKTWTMWMDEYDIIFKIKANLAYLACNNTNNQTYFEKTVYAIGEYEEPNASLEIEWVYLGRKNKTSFGKTVRAEIFAYNDEYHSNRVKLFINSSSGKKVSMGNTYVNLGETYMEYLLTVPITLTPNCNEKYPDGIYYLVAEGCGFRREWPIMVEGITKSQCKKSTVYKLASEGTKIATKESTSISPYEILSLPPIVYVGNEFSSKVRITNKYKEKHTYDAWTYVYRGSKGYSGEKEQNKKKITLEPGASKTIELKTTVVDAKDGKYKFMLKVHRDGHKRAKQTTKAIQVSTGKVSEKKDESVKIESFYTKSKKASDEINLYATVKSKEKVELKAILMSFDETQEQNITVGSTAKLKFSVKMDTGKNVFFLLIEKDGQLISVEQLALFMDDEEVTQVEVEEDLLLDFDIDFEISGTPIVSKLTGSATEVKQLVYESSSVKIVKMLPYFIIVLLALLVIALVWFKME